jgi:hypothetical protein
MRCLPRQGMDLVCLRQQVSTCATCVEPSAVTLSICQNQRMSYWDSDLQRSAREQRMSSHLFIYERFGGLEGLAIHKVGYTM